MVWSVSTEDKTYQRNDDLCSVTWNWPTRQKQENNSACHCSIQDCRKNHVYVENYGVYNFERSDLGNVIFLGYFKQK